MFSEQTLFPLFWVQTDKNTPRVSHRWVNKCSCPCGAYLLRGNREINHWEIHYIVHERYYRIWLTNREISLPLSPLFAISCRAPGHWKTFLPAERFLILDQSFCGPLPSRTVPIVSRGEFPFSFCRTTKVTCLYENITERCFGFHGHIIVMWLRTNI